MTDAKEYISKREIPQLFECLMTALMYHRPADHLSFIQECVERVKVHGISNVRWDMFLQDEAGGRGGRQLPPVTPPASSRASSRAGSRAEFVDKARPPLPPIGTVTAAEVADDQPTASKSAETSKTMTEQSQQQQGTTEKPKLRVPLTYPLVLVIGGPGSGRRRVCRELARRYNFQSICYGQLARGGAPPDELSDSAGFALLTDALLALPADCRGVFVEGFPCNPEQLGEFLLQVQRIDCALLLDFHEATLRKRLGNRSRPAEQIDALLEQFRSATLPVCRYLDDENKLLLLPIDAEPASGGLSDDITTLATDAVALLEQVLGAPENEPKSSKASPAAPEAPPAVGPQLFIRTLDFDIESASASAERDADLPACPILMLFGGPGSRRSVLARQLVAAFDGFVLVDARDALGVAGEADSRPDGPIEAEALCRLLRSPALKAARCVLLEGYPTCEADLREAFARLGRPDLAVLVDCGEADMLSRLTALPREAVAARMHYFKEETLPVVRSLDSVGKLSVIDGDRDEDSVLGDLRALVNFVIFNHTGQQGP